MQGADFETRNTRRIFDFFHVVFSPFEVLIVWPAVFSRLRAVAGLIGSRVSGGEVVGLSAELLAPPHPSAWRQPWPSDVRAHRPSHPRPAVPCRSSPSWSHASRPRGGRRSSPSDRSSAVRAPDDGAADGRGPAPPASCRDWREAAGPGAPGHDGRQPPPTPAAETRGRRRSCGAVALWPLDAAVLEVEEAVAVAMTHRGCRGVSTPSGLCSPPLARGVGGHHGERH